MELAMGILDAEHIDEIKEYGDVRGKELYSGFRLYGSAYGRIKGRQWTIKQNMTYNVNDKMKIVLDLKARSAQLFHNGSSLGRLAYGALPDEMYLVAVPYYKDSKFETTLFKVTYL